jgi:ketosteroid isomerase-like protein
VSDRAEVSERNLVLLRDGLEAYNKGDLGFVLNRATEDIEVYAHPGLVNSGSFSGRDEFYRWMREWQDAWSEITLEVRGVEELGDFLVVEIFQRAIGASSGVPVEMDIVQVFEIRGEEIARFQLYPDKRSALGALRELGAPVDPDRASAD